MTRIDLYGLAGQESAGEAVSSENRGFWDFCGEAVTFLLKSPGMIIEMIGHHLTPVPVVRDAIKFAGHCLQGKNPSEFVLSWSERKSQYYHFKGNGQYAPDRALGFTNGILTTWDDFYEQCRINSDAYGGADVHGIYNASHGLVLDLLEVLCQKIGIPTHMQAIAQASMEKIFDSMGEHKHHGIIIMEAHSQGCETIHNLSAAIKRRLDVHAYATSTLVAKS